MSQFSKYLTFQFLFVYRSEVGKKKPTNDSRHWREGCSFNLHWVDKDGMVFPIEDDEELMAATKEMLRTACPLTIIAELK